MKKLLVSCFGLGYLPVAPGTWGSLPPVVVYMTLAYLAPAWTLPVAMGVLAVLASVVCVLYSDEMIRESGRKDPRQVVADEVAGQALALFLISLMAPSLICTTAAFAFVLFRIFDIAKHWPMNRLEKLPGGWGILADDLAAGILAAVVFAVLYYTGFVSWTDACMQTSGPLDPYSAIVLGIVQGLTEFLPVSSSGHLVLAEHFLPDLNPESAEMLLFDLAIHVGTLLAILLAYFQSIRGFAVNLLETPKYGSHPLQWYRRSPSVRLAVLAVITTIVTFVLYKVFKEPLESARRLPVVASMWLVTATLLLVTDARKKTRIGLRQFGIFAAVLIGAAQAAAILPGISRSGATICTAILLGLHRRWAVEYSFLIAIPAILGGAVFKFLEEWHTIDANNLPLISVVCGMAASCLIGVVALKILLRASRKRQLKIFAVYCYILAAFVFVYLLSKS